MLKMLNIVWNSFKMALQELRVNKLRTFLSLFGITIGIFCIIGVLATVDSLKRKVSGEVQTLGTNTIYIDKWEYSGGGDNYPWWKFVKRPTPTYEEMKFIESKSELSDAVAFFASRNATVSYGDNSLTNVNIYSITENFMKIQSINLAAGRYINDYDFTYGTNSTVIGHKVAEELFGNPDKAIGKQLDFNNHKAIVVGVLEKQGNSLLGGFNYDDCILLSYRYFASIYVIKQSSPFIMVQAKKNIATTSLSDELDGIMRQARKLSPQQADDFALNDVNLLGNSLNGLFGSLNLGGWAIAGLSLLVGAFGVANIMFVTVRERTAQIGLKKAIGAKKRTILTEFLLESAFLCVIGGLLGLFLVWVLTLALSKVLPFPIFIAPNIILLALSICIVLGILSGIIPASIAAKMDPVVAIRSK
ncbi:ABC transporter permease [Hydrotalea sandarakina]|jgi:putative ABC transport system permease protein|uniref:Putative ABC transport system permease protein n=1 Tax=Hydrotalea sandarakina TaxID=1004304 RepID=A0A2W7S8Z4_9BACT|nr:ABC transporter permease [Hydrotalea sandarakina]PZX63509.1 putative ABC transport system permease protein [Hydrotalea sandarakina]